MFLLNFAKNINTNFYIYDIKEIKKKTKKDFENGCPYEEYINDIVLFLIRKVSSSSTSK